MSEPMPEADVRANPTGPIAEIRWDGLTVQVYASLLEPGKTVLQIAAVDSSRVVVRKVSPTEAAAGRPLRLRGELGALCAPAPMARLFDDGNPPPEVERQMARLCAACPLRHDCLRDAMETGAPGYRAGTTPRVRANRGPAYRKEAERIAREAETARGCG